MGDKTLRLAMWSGPRNISTAMMRSWGNRDDCVVVDEPFYASYLAATGKPHPGAPEVIEVGEINWRTVVSGLTNDSLESATIYYQKHMTHHLLPEMARDWLRQLTNCFLIRRPKEVLASYAKVIETPTLEDTGFPQQAEIFEWVCKHTGNTPPILDSADVLKNPRRILGLLCDTLGIGFQESMLSWLPGPRATDGVWAKYWYAQVEKSTGFRPYQAKSIDLPPRLQLLNAQCEEFYERLYPHRLI